jgi:hypothetical protein
MAALAALVVLLAAAASASARNRVLAPPGNSAISQYVEVVPTASGGRPASGIHPGGGSPGAGSQGLLPAATAKALAARGTDGAAVASLARATAPAVGAGKGPIQPLPAGAGASPATSLLKAVTGSSSSGGLGILLPVLLGASVLGAGLLAWRKRRAA